MTVGSKWDVSQIKGQGFEVGVQRQNLSANALHEEVDRSQSIALGATTRLQLTDDLHYLVAASCRVFSSSRAMLERFVSSSICRSEIVTVANTVSSPRRPENQWS